MAGVAFMLEDQGVIGGPIQPNAAGTGFTWNLFVVYRDTATNQKDTLTVQADTLDGDTLPQILSKLTTAVKAAGATRGFTISTVLYHPVNTVAV